MPLSLYRGTIFRLQKNPRRGYRPKIAGILFVCNEPEGTVPKCAMAKIRDKGLSEADITLEQLLRYGRTLESTIQQSLVMSNSAHATYTTAQSVNTVSSRQQQSSGKTSQGASRDYGNHRRHDDRQGQHHPLAARVHR